VTDGETLEAGAFSSWVAGLQAALRGGEDSDVPCGGCTACCRSSQFVHIGPEELDTLSHIPDDLLFAAPRLPEGHVLLGYDEHGHCPMLTEGGCSIYEHRPKTCRTYDCRVFPAAGIGAPDGEPTAIAQQTRRWRFSYPDEDDTTEHLSIRAAATFLAEHPDLTSSAAPNATQRALLAIEIHDTFLRRDDVTRQMVVVAPAPEAVHVALSRRHPDPP
jgi:Fe-S-cluster containining protein